MVPLPPVHFGVRRWPLFSGQQGRKASQQLHSQVPFPPANLFCSQLTPPAMAPFLGSTSEPVDGHSVVVLDGGDHARNKLEEEE